VQIAKLLSCPACGGQVFGHADVLWPELIQEWSLSSDEVTYINRQQGTHCTVCQNKLRSMVLARAICRVLEQPEPLSSAVLTQLTSFKVLEINESGQLSPMLENIKDYTIGTYPEVDMMDMPYSVASFDLVVHSDTLEHIRDPIRALQECRRILKPTGACCFTVPVIFGRMTRSRAGLSPSYHGAPGYHGAKGTEREDYLVNTEFGSDMWCWPMRSGFSRVEIESLEFPSATVMTCRP
jgi:SAM-dependent methyltransferase